MKKQFGEICDKVNSSTCYILKEIANNLETMNKSSNLDLSIEEMKKSIQDLKTHLKSMPAVLFIQSTDELSETKSQEKVAKEEAVLATINNIALAEIVPLVTFVSLLIEIASRVEDIVDTVEELANMAEFKTVDHQDKNTTTTTTNLDGQEKKDEKIMIHLESV